MMILITLQTIYLALPIILGVISREYEKVDRQSYETKAKIIKALLSGNSLFIICCYQIICFFESILILDSNNKIYSVFFLLPLPICTLEWIHSKFKKKFDLVTGLISFKVSFLALTIIVMFFSSVEAETYIERMTGVSSETFSQFTYLIAISIALFFWLVVLQIIQLMTSAYYVIFFQKDSVKLGIVILSSVFSGIIVYGAFQRALLEIFIPWVIDSYFVKTMFHENKSINKEKICTNIRIEENIAILSNGSILLAKKNKKNWSFKGVLSLND